MSFQKGILPLLKSPMEALWRTGFFNIVGAGVINKIVSFACGIILVRVISKSDYGAYSYAANIVNYFVLFNGLGVSACIVQLFVEKEHDSAAAELAYRASSVIGVLWDVLLTIAIMVAGAFLPLPVEGANLLLLLLAPFPLVSLIADLQQQRLRAEFRNKEYAFATNLNSISTILLSVSGAAVGSSIGLSIGRSLSAVCSTVAVRAIYKVKVYFKPFRIERNLLMDILKLSITVCATNAVSQALILVGTTIVGLMTGDDAAVAAYSAAATIPFALLFIPGMVMTYAAPYFIRKSHDRSWVIRAWGLCTAGVGALSLSISITCIACSDWLIPLVFGGQYKDAVPPFQMLMAAFMVGSTLRTVAGNVLASHRKYLFNLVSNIASLTTAVAATLLLIPAFGMTGAAAGYLLAIIVGSIISVIGVLKFAGCPSRD